MSGNGKEPEGECSSHVDKVLDSLIDLSLHKREYHNGKGSLLEMSIEFVMSLSDTDIQINFGSLLLQRLEERGFSDRELRLPSPASLGLKGMSDDAPLEHLKERLRDMFTSNSPEKKRRAH